MKLHAALVTGFLCVIACAAQRRAGAGGPRGRASSPAPPPLVQRIETSRGTCECVPYYDCDADNTVDTTIFRRLRARRQIEERPEQCTGLNVCCLVDKNTNNNNNGGDNSNNGGNSNNNGGNNNSNGANTNNGANGNNNENGNTNNNGGDTNNGDGEPQNPNSTPTPCICLAAFQCGKNDSEVFQAGKGIIKPRIPCEKDEVLCCHPSFAGGFSPTPPSPTPDGGLRTCGTRNKNIDFSINRIQTGGDGLTNFGEYPWTLVILKSETLADGSVTNNAFLCGASLIQPSVAITAAHCVHNVRGSDLKVRAGEWDTRQNNAAEILPYQEQRVAEVILHPRFNNGTLHNDVALLKLTAPFTLADNVGLVCLPGESSPDPASCIATGWGKDAFSSDAKYQNVMKQVSLPYVPPGECQSKLRKTRLGNHFILDKSFNCAGGISNEDTCQGDGGGPLSCIVSGDERFYLIGITSWGIGCGTDNVPGVYTNVRLFSDWISSHLE